VHLIKVEKIKQILLITSSGNQIIYIYLTVRQMGKFYQRTI